MSIEQLPKRLLKLRKEQGLTQQELAEKLHYSNKVISKWERGESLPDLEAMSKLAVFYNRSIDEILNTTDTLEQHQLEEVEIIIHHIKKPSLVLKLSIIPFIIAWLLLITQGPLVFGLASFILVMVVFTYGFLISYNTWKASFKGHDIIIQNKPTKTMLWVDDHLVDQSGLVFSSSLKLSCDIETYHLKVIISSIFSLKCDIIIT